MRLYLSWMGFTHTYEHTKALCLLPRPFHLIMRTSISPPNGSPAKAFPSQIALEDLNQVPTHLFPGSGRLLKPGPPEQAPHPACSPQTFLSLLLSLWREQHSLSARRPHG